MLVINAAFVLLLGLSGLNLGGAETLQCTQDIDEYIAGVSPASAKEWALEMLDSSTKFPPDGLMEGSFIMQMGNFDECMAARGPTNGQGEARFKGKYCRVQLGFKVKYDTAAAGQLFFNQMSRAYEKIGKKFEYPGLESKAGLFPEGGGALTAEWAVCAPSSCSAEGVKRVADFNLGLFFSALNLNVSTTVLESSCIYEDDGSKDFDAGSWIFIVFFTCLSTLMVVSAIIECVWPKDREVHVVVKAFSLKSNLKELFTLPKEPFPGQLTCLNGIRVITTCWVILLHCYMVTSWLPHTNALSAVLKYTTQWSLAPILSGGLAMDTFFLLSGLLAVYIPLIDQQEGRSFNIFKYYIYRYLRITLPLAMVVFYLSTVHDISGSGPLWDVMISGQTDRCKKNWWATLLYITNYFEPLETACVKHSWFLIMDMQLALLAPIVIFPLLKWPKMGLGLAGLLTLGSMAVSFAYTYIYDLQWTIFFFRPITSSGNFNRMIYTNTPARAVPYLFGMLLAYALAKKVTFKLPKWATIMEWILNSAICLTIIYTIVIPYDLDFNYEPVAAAFYSSFHRLGWSLGVGWVIWACVNGYGGPVNCLLSWKYFLPLSKLSFCAYLVHMDLIYFHAAMMRNNPFFSNFETIFDYFGYLIMMLPFALFLYLGVDAPTKVLIRALFRKPIRPIGEEKFNDEKSIIKEKSERREEMDEDFEQDRKTREEELEEIKSEAK